MKPQITEKFAEIEAHMGSIRKMLEQDKDYRDIEKSVSAIRSELDNVSDLIVQDLSEHK